MNIQLVLGVTVLLEFLLLTCGNYSVAAWIKRFLYKQEPVREYM